MAILKTALLYYDQAIRDGSIRKAADNLHIASSAVNRQILQLEEELGVELFVRLPRGIRPTAAGEALLNTIRRWNRESTVLKQEIEGLKGGVRGTIRVAAAESLTEEVVPKAIMALRERFPLIDFTIISGDNYRIKSELLTKEADVLCAFDVTDAPRTDLVHRIKAEIGVVMRPDHPLASAEAVTLADCLPFPVIAPGMDWLKHSTIGELFEEGKAPLRIAARAERIGMLKNLVRAGVGIAFLSTVGLEQDIADGALAWVPLAKGIVRPVTISLLIRSGRVLPVHIGTFLDLLKAELIGLETGRR